MNNIYDPKTIFKQDKEQEFDFSHFPDLVLRKDHYGGISKKIDQNDLSRWCDAQNEFIKWTSDTNVFTRKYIEKSRFDHDEMFKQRGNLKGNILDIGGGWGLYRQWWDQTPNDLFIVHDPGVERFNNGPHQFHYEFYERAFSLPMTFVEGFGEDLPYLDNTFDICLITEALDHCIDPKKVFEESYRCLKPNGTIFVLQHCHDSMIKNILSNLYYKVVPSEHLNHFSKKRIDHLLKSVGFNRIDIKNAPTAKNTYMFSGFK